MAQWTADEMMFIGLRGQERAQPYDQGGERFFAVVYHICKCAEEGIQNFPVKLSVELHISEAWKVILPLNKRSGNGNFEDMETARI